MHKHQSDTGRWRSHWPRGAGVSQTTGRDCASARAHTFRRQEQPTGRVGCHSISTRPGVRVQPILLSWPGRLASASQTGRDGGARGGWAKLPTLTGSRRPHHDSCACSLPIRGRPEGFSLLGWVCAPIAGHNTARPRRGKSVDPYGRLRHGLGRNAPGLWLAGLGGPVEGRSGQGGQMQKEPSARRPRCHV